MNIASYFQFDLTLFVLENIQVIDENQMNIWFFYSF